VCSELACLWGYCGTTMNLSLTVEIAHRQTYFSMCFKPSTGRHHRNAGWFHRIFRGKFKYSVIVTPLVRCFSAPKQHVVPRVYVRLERGCYKLVGAWIFEALKMTLPKFDHKALGCTCHFVKNTSSFCTKTFYGRVFKFFCSLFFSCFFQFFSRKPRKWNPH